MNKTAQNLTWNCLPLEVKKEVKRQYQIAINAKEYYTECTLEYLFGIDNLTSDAEGEEMLMVSRKEVQEAYKTSKEIVNNEQYGTCQYSMHTQIMCVLENLFGTKCLPDGNEDNFATKESNPFKYSVGQKVILHFYGGEVSTITEAFNDGGVWNKYKVKMLPTRVWNENELDPYEEPKPAEPKFKVGDKVKYKGRVKVVISEMMPNRYYRIALPNNQSPICKHESDLEPYTEPILQPSSQVKETKASVETGDNLFGQHFEATSIATHGKTENHIADAGKMMRLNIAAMITASICSSDTIAKQFNSIEHVVRRALDIADTLIAEAEKGGDK